MSNYISPVAYAWFYESQHFISEVNIFSKSFITDLQARAPEQDHADESIFASGVLTSKQKSDLENYLLSRGYLAARIHVMTLEHLALALEGADDYQSITNALRVGEPLDVFLADIANANGKILHGLERYGDTIDEVNRARDIGRNALLSVLIKRLDTERCLEQYALEQYFLGNIAEMEAARISFRATDLERSALLARDLAVFAERNKRFVDEIDRLMRSDPSAYFIAIGAGHLIGTDGVVEGLRRAGWTLRPCADERC